MQQAADREAPQAGRRQTELLADLDGAEGHPAGVLVGRGVLLAEPGEQSAEVGSHERLAPRDEIDGTQVAAEHARRRGPAQVERDGEPDERDARDLEAVPEPPVEVRVAHQEGRHEREPEPPDADDDREISAAAAQRVGASRAERDEAQQHGPGDQQEDRRPGSRRGNARNQGRVGDSESAHGEDHDHCGELDSEDAPQIARICQRGHAQEREQSGADRDRDAAGDGDDAVRADEHTRRREPVDGEQRGHGREGATCDHGARVSLARTAERQQSRRGEGCERARPDEDAVGRSCPVDPVRPLQEEHDRGNCQARHGEQDRTRELHLVLIGASGPELETLYVIYVSDNSRVNAAT